MRGLHVLPNLSLTEVGAIIIPVLQVRKFRLDQIK